MRILLATLALAAVSALCAQTEVLISNVAITEKEVVTSGSDATLRMKNAEGVERQVIYDRDGVKVNVKAKVTTHNVRRSSLKDSAVNLTFEIDMDINKDHDNKRVEKIFYLDQSRTGKVTQRFNFKNGITMRGITLTFDVEIK